MPDTQRAPADDITPPDFGDYVLIEQHRYGGPDEMYVHKVIGRLQSNSWIDAPARTGVGPVLHGTCEDVLQVICCGISEDTVIRHRAADCRPLTLRADRAIPSRAGVPDIDDAADILRNMIKGIEAHGMYSQESTLMSLQQAYFALRPANQAPPVPAAVDVGAAHAQHARDSAELRRLCSERDQARRERDLLTVEVAGLNSSIGHLSRLVDELRPSHDRYQYLRDRDLDALHMGGLFAGKTPDNVVLNGETLDAAIDAARATQQGENHG